MTGRRPARGPTRGSEPLPISLDMDGNILWMPAWKGR